MLKLAKLFATVLVFSFGIGSANAIVVGSGGYSGSTTFYADFDGDGVLDGSSGTSYELTSATAFSVTASIYDCCLTGDYFDLFVDGVLVGTTPVVAIGGGTLSQGSFDLTLSAGTHTIVWIDALLRDVNPAGYSPAGASVSFSAFSAVPEASTLMMLGLGLIGFAFSRRKAA